MDIGQSLYLKESGSLTNKHANLRAMGLTDAQIDKAIASGALGGLLGAGRTAPAIADYSSWLNGWTDELRPYIPNNTNNLAYGKELEYNGDTARTGVTFTQGSIIPNEILLTKPLYSPVVDKWLDNGGKISVKNGIWEYINQQGVSVTYKNGYPDFKVHLSSKSRHIKSPVRTCTGLGFCSPERQRDDWC
ncbi:MAG: hypothetical protein ACOX7P_01525 [Oscillospiraceae bacterium]